MPWRGCRYDSGFLLERDLGEPAGRERLSILQTSVGGKYVRKNGGRWEDLFAYATSSEPRGVKEVGAHWKLRQISAGAI
jgi:hypothetical protein